MSGADARGLVVLPSSANFECEALRAVLAFHRRGDRRDSLLRSFERQPVERSTCDRIVEVAVKQGANVYVTDQGHLDQLRRVLDKGVPVIVAMSSKRGDTEQSHFAIVVGVDGTTISLLYSPPAEDDHRVSAPALPLKPQQLALDEFQARWHWTGEGIGATPIDRWFMVVHFDGRELAGVFGQGRDVAPPDRRRRWQILCAAWSIFVTELVLAFFAYRDPNDLIPPLLALALAVIGFTLIDFFARPEKRAYTTTLAPRWYRGYLPFWCLVPFITAVGGSIWVHYSKWTDARAEVRQLAQEVKAAVEWPDDSKQAATETQPQGSGAPLPSPSAKRDAPPGIAAPTSPDAEDEADNPIVDVVSARHWFAVDDATNRCWITANRRNDRETALVRSGAAHDSRGRANPFAAFGAFLPNGNRRRMAHYLADFRTWRCFTTERVTAKVATIVSTRYRDDKDSPEAKRFTELARVVGHDVLMARGDIGKVCNDIMVGYRFGAGPRNRGSRRSSSSGSRHSSLSRSRARSSARAASTPPRGRTAIDRPSRLRSLPRTSTSSCPACALRSCSFSAPTMSSRRSGSRPRTSCRSSTSTRFPATPRSRCGPRRSLKRR